MSYLPACSKWSTISMHSQKTKAALGVEVAAKSMENPILEVALQQCIIIKPHNHLHLCRIQMIMSANLSVHLVILVCSIYKLDSVSVCLNPHLSLSAPMLPYPLHVATVLKLHYSLPMEQPGTQESE